MNTVFIGLGASLAYALLGSLILLICCDKEMVRAFLVAYTSSFNTLITFGLALGTALVVSRSQSVIPQTIEGAFSESQLSGTLYNTYKQRFESGRRSMTFSATFVAVAFTIFSQCHFPLEPPAEALMIIAACAQYGLGVYVGRKLCYAGMMLHSLLEVPVSRNIFKRRELDDVDSYVHIASTLTLVSLYVHIRGYHEGPFLYDTPIGQGIKSLVFLPAIIATPVLLIFNFYPRIVLRKLYNQSIDVEIAKLQETLKNETLTEFEKRSYVIEVDKMSRDELRNSLQLSLADLPIGITILVMVLEPLVKR